MRRFLGSAWFGLLACVVLGVVPVIAFALLKPDGADVGNGQIVEIFTWAGWLVGPVIGLLSLILFFVLNGLRRLARIRRVASLHPVVVLLAILPWLIWGIQLVAYEPRFTPIARAVIDFIAAPMLWGALAATLFTLVLSLGLLLRTKR